MLLWEHLERGERGDVESKIGGFAEGGGRDADGVRGEAFVAQLGGEEEREEGWGKRGGAGVGAWVVPAGEDVERFEDAYCNLGVC